MNEFANHAEVLSKHGKGHTYTRPVPATVHQAHLLLHLVNVVPRPRRRVDAALDGSILSWQPKGVPPHREHYIVALERVEASKDVGYGVHSEMAQMQVARRVWEHGQDVFVFLVPATFGGLVGAGAYRRPPLSPFLVQSWQVQLGVGIAPSKAGRDGSHRVAMTNSQNGDCSANRGTQQWVQAAYASSIDQRHCYYIAAGLQAGKYRAVAVVDGTELSNHNLPIGRAASITFFFSLVRIILG
jgi:hypothetical protein